MIGLSLNLEDIFGLDILTCYHMEEGKVPSSMVGSQDAHLPALIGEVVNQTIAMAMKIMQMFKITKCGMTGRTILDVAVNTIQL
jgi:hypothetical protein